MKRLERKVAIVTGGTGGIGQAITELFAKEGAKVAIFDVAKKPAADLLDRIATAGGQARFYQVDITSSPEVERAVRAVWDDLGPVDILVNNAAIPGTSRLTHEATVQILTKSSPSTSKGPSFAQSSSLPICWQSGVKGAWSISPRPTAWSVMRIFRSITRPRLR